MSEAVRGRARGGPTPPQSTHHEGERQSIGPWTIPVSPCPSSTARRQGSTQCVFGGRSGASSSRVRRLHAEPHCAAGRNPALIGASATTAVLDTIILVDVTRGDLLAAGTQAPLRSADAIHLATALRLGVDEIVTYGIGLTRAAEAAGLRIIAPA